MGTGVDVGGAAPHEATIDAVVAAGVISGCSTKKYCLEDTVTKGEIAGFVNAARQATTN